MTTTNGQPAPARSVYGYSCAYTGSRYSWSAAELDVPIMVYKVGEALRFDEVSIRIGLRGIINVIRTIGMSKLNRKAPKPSAILRNTPWVRALSSGIARTTVKLGELLREGGCLAYLGDAGAQGEQSIHAPFNGIIIGRANLPLVYQGEAMFHIGRSHQTLVAQMHLGAMNVEDPFSMPELVEEAEIV